MNIDINKSTILNIGKTDKYYSVTFKDQMRTYRHIIKGSKFEILYFLIKNCNIYNLQNITQSLFNSKDTYVHHIFSIIKKKNNIKQFSNTFFFADGTYNYMCHEFKEINYNIQKINKKNICLIL
jgi:hypothetical protein